MARLGYLAGIVATILSVLHELEDRGVTPLPTFDQEQLGTGDGAGRITDGPDQGRFSRIRLRTNRH